MKPLSLYQSCMLIISKNILNFRKTICDLPVEVGEDLFRTYIHEPSAEVLSVFAESFWRPESLSLSKVPLDSRNARKCLECLSLISSSLIKLDLSYCTWIEDLQPITTLRQLRCLNLNSCFHLSGHFLHVLQDLPFLHCLELENLKQVSDDYAASTLPYFPSLLSLNLSGTFVGDLTLNALSYGIRLKNWRNQQSKEIKRKMTKKSDPWSEFYGKDKLLFCPFLSETFSDTPETLWPISKIEFLKLKHTKITNASIPYLSSLLSCKLIDIRNTSIDIKQAHILRSHLGLLNLPNNAFLFGKTNTILLSALRNTCGCFMKHGVGHSNKTLSSSSSSASSLSPLPFPFIKFSKKPEWVIDWEVKGMMLLMETCAFPHNIYPHGVQSVYSSQ